MANDTQHKFTIGQDVAGWSPVGKPINGYIKAVPSGDSQCYWVQFENHAAPIPRYVSELTPREGGRETVVGGIE